MDKENVVRIIDSKTIEFNRTVVGQDGKETNEVERKEFDNVYAGTRFVKVYKAGKQGLFNYAGEEVLPCLFDKINVDEEKIGAVSAQRNNSKDLFLFLSDKMSENVYFRLYYCYYDYFVLTTKTGKKFAIYSRAKKCILYQDMSRKDFRIVNGWAFVIDDKKSGKTLLLYNNEVTELVSATHFDKGVLVQYKNGEYAMLSAGQYLKLGKKE